MSIYLLRAKGFQGLDYLKLGWSTQPFQRIANGFWDNVHPPALCNKLGPKKLEVLGVWAATKAEELALHARLIPDCGEWYFGERLPEIRAALEPFPAQPLQPLPPPNQDNKIHNKRPCCSGFQHFCRKCGETFADGRKWLRHRNADGPTCHKKHIAKWVTFLEGDPEPLRKRARQIRN